jgi:hypothetical protein
VIAMSRKNSDLQVATRTSLLIFIVLAFLISAWIVPYFNGQPGYPDAFYHYNGAKRLAEGHGFVEDYLWTYQGAPASLPAPSHLYWMPGTSILASIGMSWFGPSYPAAQIALVVCVWGAALVAYFLGLIIGGTGRHAWGAGLLTLAGGFFLRVYGTTDTFAPYAFFGAAALFAQGWAMTTGRIRAWAIAGALAAAGHLIRSDGLLLVVVGVGVAFFGAWRLVSMRVRIGRAGAFLLAYIVIMTPWFSRNLESIGTLLPTGGTQAIWYLTYDDIFNYPPQPDPRAFTADGIRQLIQVRIESFTPIVQNFIAVEGMVVLIPLMLVALWKRRQQPFYQPFIVFAIGIHLAFWLLFPLPGVRGGLFHASAALIPWWAALGITGIDDVVQWIARYRKNWRPRTASRLFTAMLVVGVVWLSWTISIPKRISAPYSMPLYPALQAALPPDSRIMINDPAQLYYYTGIGGVTFPNAAPETILEIAARYDIDYVVIEGDNISGLAVPAPMLFDLEKPPLFLREVSHDVFQRPEARLYEIVRENQ